MRLVGLALLTLAALVVGTPASATFGSIQPGDEMNGGGCTLNFVFDGVGALAGKVYIGTAAHCVDGDGGVGASVDSAPYEDFGTVAIMDFPWDWAFIEVKPEFHRFVDPAVKGHPAYPTGIATKADTSTGDLLQYSGSGRFFDATAPTQEKRVGVLLLHQTETVHHAGPVAGGDSGGPIVHIESGKALAFQSRVTGGGAYDHVLQQAAQRGFTVALRTV